MTRYLIYVVCAFVILLGVVSLVGLVMPFEPMNIREYVVEVERVCPGEPVHVEYRAIIGGGPYTLDSLDGTAYWIYPPNGKPYSSITLPVNTDIQPSHGAVITIESPVQRVAPLTPRDDWYVGSDFQVHGRMFGLIQRTQQLQLRSDKPTIVKPYDDPTCFTDEEVQGN